MGNQERIDRLAARQHGVFSHSQLIEAGFDKSTVYRRVDSGAWVRLDSRVYALRSAAATWNRQMWAAVLSRPEALVGAESAAYLHGIRGFKEQRPVIVVPGSSNARSSIARVIRAEHFVEIDSVPVAGLPTTSIPETLLCLAGRIRNGYLASALDDVLLSRRMPIAELEVLLDREEQRRTKGIRILREMVGARSEDAPAVDGNYLEALLERVLSGGSIPRWVREHPVSIKGRPGRVDAFIPDWLLVAEADGRSWHMRNGDFEADRERDNELAKQGIQVLRFTYEMLKNSPEECLQTILETGAVRSAQGRAQRDALL